MTTAANQELQEEVVRLKSQLATRDRELTNLKTRLLASRNDEKRAAIVRIDQAVLDVHETESFEEALHVLALQSRLMIGAHQSAVSYVPDGDFERAIHTHSFSEKYEEYNTYDVMPTGAGIWGLVVKNRVTVRMTEQEVYSHQIFQNFSGLEDARGLEHPPMPGWLAAPVLGQDGGILGVIQLSDRFEGDFTEEEEDQLAKLTTLFAPTFELQKVNQRLQERASDLEQVSSELMRSNNELGEFAYVASHDLQEPLRMISSYMELLRRRYRDKLESGAQEFIDFAVDGAQRMQTLIEDLLTYSRAGAAGTTLASTDCEEALQRAMANLSAAIADTNAAVTHEPLPLVSGDPSQLTQLFQNLVGNSIKFAHDARPKVHISVARIEEGQQFSVTDNGIGIDPKYGERVFQVFQRLHARGEYEGTGIGLSICKKIVERHGGRIWVESRPGKGSTFHFTLMDETPRG